MTVRRLVGRGSGSTARLTRVVLVALVVGGFAALGSTALGGSTAGTGATARSAKSALITPARCNRNKAAGTINYISPFGYDAAATIMEVFMAEKLGYFKALCLKVAFNASSFTAEQLVSSGRGQVTAIGSAADHILARCGRCEPHRRGDDGRHRPARDLRAAEDQVAQGFRGRHARLPHQRHAGRRGHARQGGGRRLEGEDDPADELRPDRRHARSDRRRRRLRLQRAAPAEGGRHAVQRVHARSSSGSRERTA